MPKMRSILRYCIKPYCHEHAAYAIIKEDWIVFYCEKHALQEEE